jgi:hypothetical protein
MEDGLSALRAELARCSAEPVTIGWREYAAFPEWDIRRLKVKIDTGARTSALGVAGYDLHNSGDGGCLVAELHLALGRKAPHQFKVIRVPVLRMVRVRTSSGVKEERPLVETTIRLGPVTKKIHLTITNRSQMRFRMILGRKALERDFLVDVSKQYLLKSS